MSSISSLPSEVQGLFWTNIGLFGGNVRFPNLPVRLCVLSVTPSNKLVFLADHHSRIVPPLFLQEKRAPSDLPCRVQSSDPFDRRVRLSLTLPLWSETI